MVSWTGVDGNVGNYGSKGCGIAVKSSVGRCKQSARFEVREEQCAFGKAEYEDDPQTNPALNFDFSQGSIPVGSGCGRIFYLWGSISERVSNMSGNGGGALPEFPARAPWLHHQF
jgi:hypothetical protein